MDEERRKIMEKRSSIRSWKESEKKRPLRNVLFIVIVVFLISLALAWGPLMNNNGNNSSANQQKKLTNTSNMTTPSPPPSPVIKLNSPKNIVYNTDTPTLDLAVTGTNLRSVLLSLDDKSNISIPNDGKTAVANLPLLTPVFQDNFSSKKKWVNVSGQWDVKNGRYVVDQSSNLSLSFVDMNFSTKNFSIEGTVKPKNGTKASAGIIFSSADPKNFYYAIALTDSKKWAIGSYAGSFDHKVMVNDSKLQANKDYKMKLFIVGGQVILNIDGVEKAKYNFGTLYGGRPGLLAENSGTEFDDFSVSQPLSDGRHKLTIFANNTAGVSSQIFYFNVSTSLPKAEVNTVGKIGTPLVKDGFEITINSVTTLETYTSIWMSVRNMENIQKPFKLNPKPMVIDNISNQYDNVNMARSSEISQTDLYSLAKREGAVFFNPVKEGASPEKLVLYINGNKSEFMLNSSN